MKESMREYLFQLWSFSILFVAMVLAQYVLKILLGISLDRWIINGVYISECCIGLSFLLLAGLSVGRMKTILGKISLFFIGGTGMYVIAILILLMKIEIKKVVSE